MRLEKVHRIVDEWVKSGGSGVIRFARSVEGEVYSGGVETCWKLPELDQETQDALILLAQKFNSPDWRVVCVGPDHLVDRIYVFHRKG